MGADATQSAAVALSASPTVSIPVIYWVVGVVLVGALLAWIGLREWEYRRDVGGLSPADRQEMRWRLLDTLYHATGRNAHSVGRRTLQQRLGWKVYMLTLVARELADVRLAEFEEGYVIGFLRSFKKNERGAAKGNGFERLSLTTGGTLAWERCHTSEKPSLALARVMHDRGAEVEIDLRRSSDAMVHVGTGGSQTRVDVNESPGAKVTLTVNTTTFSSDLSAALAVAAAALAQPGILNADQRARAANALAFAQEQGANPTNSRLASAVTTLHELAIGAAGNALWDAAKLVLAVVLAQFRS